MKKARAADYWRGLQSKGQPNYASSIAATGIPNFPNETIKISGPITILTGLNGVGKSTILNSIHLLTARNEEIKIDLSLLKNCDGQLRGDIISSGAVVAAQVDLKKGEASQSPENVDFEVILIDTAFEIPALIKSIRHEKNLTEALAQVSPIIYSQAELIEISWLVGKTYAACHVFELEGFYDRSVAPYFNVESHGVQYGAEAMGVGEMSLLYIYWTLKRAQPNSLLLIEEPETYISSRSQEALMDCLAHTCLTKNCTAIVTTHSPQIFEKVPPKNTLILVQSAGTCSAIVKETPDARLSALSVPQTYGKAGYLLVEDRMAREFAKCWIASACQRTIGQWRVVDMSSSGQVLSCLSFFPASSDNWFRVVGLLDGDERDKGHKTEGTLFFLPTKDPPEILLRSAILGNQAPIAQRLGLDSEEFQIALSSIEGLDHHDWFIELVKIFIPHGLTFEKLVASSTEQWILSNKTTSNACAAELQSLLI